jgi:malate synthase
MEDAATAEIARSQVWQWIRHGRFERRQVADAIDELDDGDGKAREIFEQVALGESFVEFLTLPAYDHLEELNGD